MDTYNPNKLTAAPKKVDISLRQLADFDQTGGSRDRVDNVRDNQVLVSLSKFNRPKTFSFRYISDLLQGGTGISISTDKDGLTTISNTGVRKIIAGSNISISPTTGVGNVTINNTATPAPLGYYGAWQDDVTQTAAVSNTGYPMIFRTTDLANGIAVVTNGTNLTRITFANTGVYNLQFSSQFQNTDTKEHDVTIWLRLNGVDVPKSSGFVAVPPKHGGINGHCVVSWNYLLNVVAGDYYELMWSTTDATHITMQFYAAGSPPPSAASVILTVTQQAGIMAGTGITAINSLTGAVQTLATGTTGTDFAISSTGTTHTFNLPTASATNRGALSSADWSIFNGKFNLPSLTSGSILFSNGTTIAQDNANLFWDDTNNRLGIGTVSPLFRVDAVGGDARFNSIRVGRGGGDSATNTVLGDNALTTNSTGVNNTALGQNTLSANTSSNNTAVGYFALRFNTTGATNTAIGSTSFLNLSSGSNNTALGRNSGRYIADGSTSLTIASQSIFIGTDTKALADSQTNQIVIGYNAIGLGSNTVVLGNDSVTRTALKGNVLIGTTTDVTSSILTVASTTKGFLPPRMTTAQKNAIASPVNGLVVYDTDLKQLCTYNGTWGNSPFYQQSLAGVKYFTDFDNTASVTPNFASFVSGTGADTRRTVTTIPNQTVNQIGFSQYQTGTTATGYATHINEGFVGRQFVFGGGTWIFETFVNVETLSTVTERFRFVTGFGDNPTNASDSNAAIFTYDEGGTQNGTIASPNWQCVTSVGAVRTLTTTSTAVVASAWVKLRIEVNAAATSVTFFINGTLVATHTTNIPTFVSAANPRGFNVKQSILKSIGTANRSVFCDYLLYENNLTTLR
jgi:hypothetical protein